MFGTTKAMGAVTLALLLWDAGAAVAQSAGEPPLSSLHLTPEKVSHLQAEVSSHDYVGAEKLLLEEVEADPHSARSAPLLAYLGSVYFLNRDYPNAAIAWKKSEAIAPLSSALQLSLAMTYIRISHPDWARPVLESLSAHEVKNALYPYWLGRLEYDAHHYPEATRRFQQAIAVDPAMARAYDNLGLCFFAQDEIGRAVESYKTAIELDRTASNPSPWPHINLAQTLEFSGRSQEAEAELRLALRLDPELAAAHYQLGMVMEHLGQPENAMPELREAIRLDGSYAEPHIALANIYKRLGKTDAANDEVKAYVRLHANAVTNK